MDEQIQKYRWYQTERIKGLCLSQLGKGDEAVVCLENAVNGYKALLHLIDDPLWTPHVIHDLGMVLFDLSVFHYENSNMLAAQSFAHESIAIWRQVRSNFLELAKLLNLLGFYHYQCGEYREAWLAFQEVAECYKLLEPDSNYIYILNSIGDLQLALDEWDLAEKTYQKAITVGKTLEDEFHSFSAYLGLSQLEMMRGKYEKAMQFLRDAARVRKFGPDSAWYQSRLGEVFLEMGQLDLSIESLQNALKQWEHQLAPNQEQIQNVFWLGRAYFAKGQVEQALKCLEDCLMWVARLGYDHFQVIAGRRAVAFLQFATQSWQHNPQLRSLIDRIASFRTGLTQFQNETLVTEAPKLHLEIFAFGTGRVRRNGELISKSDWQASKTRALFFYLAERKRSQNNEIKLNFWPEFNTSQATTNLQSTLWRARKALGGKEVVIVQGDEYSLAPHLIVWYDVAEFREYLNRAAQLDISPFEQAELWRRAIEIYRGEYLEDIWLEWTEAIRNELQAHYVDTLIKLATWEVERGRYVEARNLYETAIQKEPYRDDIHLALIKCFVRSSAPSAAEAHFMKYKQFLAESGLEPSSELQNDYKNLL